MADKDLGTNTHGASYVARKGSASNRDENRVRTLILIGLLFPFIPLGTSEEHPAQCQPARLLYDPLRLDGQPANEIC